MGGETTPILLMAVPGVDVLSNVVHIGNGCGSHVAVVGVHLVEGRAFDWSSLSKDPTHFLVGDAGRDQHGRVGGVSGGGDLAQLRQVGV